MNNYSGKRYAILAEGNFGPHTSKTANGLLKYNPEQAAAVIDSTCKHVTAEEALGWGGSVPVVSTLGKALVFEPNALLIGIAPMGGRLPDEWRGILSEAIEAGLDIVSGLHTFIGDDPELGGLARKKGVSVHDLRKPPEGIEVATDRWRERKAYVVLTTGTDANVGKMTALTELMPVLTVKHPRTGFIATGQTGILLYGKGVAVDAVVSDFLAGAIEEEIMREEKEHDLILVEGQGSLYHQGFSGVTLGLLHGCMPDGIIICHESARERNEYGLPLPSMRDFMDMHRMLLAPFREPQFIGVSLDTSKMNEADALRAVQAIKEETGLVVTDPVRFGVDELAEAVLFAADMEEK